MTFQIIARAMDPKLYDELESYRVTDEALMPEEYRKPNGRWKSDDWFFFRWVTRMERVRRVPLPFRIKRGVKTQEPMLFDPAYPLSPDARVEMRDGLMYVMTDRGGYGLVVYEAFINGRWRECFWKYTRAFEIRFFGRYRFSMYKGLHQDNHVSPPWAPSGFRSDLMGWFPEVAMSLIKEIP